MEAQNKPEKTFFCPQEGHLRAKREYFHAIYAMGREEKAETKAEKGQYVCLQKAKHHENEPMWNSSDGRTTEKQKGRRLLREGNGARGK